jgi:hypothetical protein
MDPSPGQQQTLRRFQQVLDKLFEQGTTQQAVAEVVGVPAQYLSDIKLGRKPVAELFARRLAEAYNFDYRWLLTGEGNPPQFLNRGVPTLGPAGPVRLPLFDHPISGQPHTLPDWKGALVEVTGAAAAQAAAASEPYVVRFQKNDRDGRLKPDDLVLVSQTVNKTAEIQVVRQRNHCFFARQAPNGTFRRIATGQSLASGAQPVGHCVGIVWGLL